LTRPDIRHLDPRRSLAASVALGLFLLLSAAISAIYLAVVPSLRHRLVNRKLAGLQTVVTNAARHFPSNQFSWQTAAEDTAAERSVRVVLLANAGTSNAKLETVVADSGGGRSAGFVNDVIAARAQATLSPQRGTVKRGGEPFAEAAAPVGGGSGILLVSSPLADAYDSVDYITARLLIASAAVLVAAVAIGLGAARLLTRRIGRLDRVAASIAEGSFGVSAALPGDDELARLARTLDRMRLQLARLDLARRTFIANASHELKTPLFSLSGFLELITDEDLDSATQSEFLQSMREQIDRMIKLSADLLDLTRLDAGRVALNEREMDLANVAEGIVRELSPIAAQRGKTLQAHAEARIPIYADEDKLAQIARILVDNALKHTPLGTHVTVRATREDAVVVLSVEDEGPGSGAIPAEDEAAIFDRFYRIDGTLASGSGLGLALAHDLAQVMRGEIVLESGPGRTTFRFTLPDRSLGNDLMRQRSLA
jgi:two-component system, OmpR family, sensor kinase